MKKMNSMHLSPISESHAESRAAIINTSEVANGLMIKIPVNLEKTRGWCRKVIDQNDRIDFCASTSEEIIGFGGLVSIKPTSKTCELYIFISPDFFGKGQGKKLLDLLVQYAKIELNLRKISLYVTSNNKAAINLYEDFGFKLEGKLEKHAWHRGEYRDRLIYSIFTDRISDNPEYLYDSLK